MTPGPRLTPDPAATAVALTPLGLLAILLRRWRLVVAVPLLCAVSAGVFAFCAREYTARSRFAPQTARSDLARFGGLAAQFGLPVSTGASGESPDFYVDLLTSGEILQGVVQQEYRFAERAGRPDSLAGTWLDLLAIEGDLPDERLQNGVDALRRSVEASANLKSGLVTLRINAPWPGLAEAVNARMLTLLGEFDRERRQAGARAEREFTEGRLAAAKLELERAESDLAVFLDHNRRPESSRLLMELERYQRQVALRQQVYAGLAQAFEQARLEEVRNTPVITIVDRPEGSARGRQGMIVTALLGFLLGGVAAIGLTLMVDYFERQADSPAMDDLRRSIRRDSRRERTPDSGAAA
jgi:uncharacterized protein involved in exopolysaccharide biosynthesis